MHQFSKELKVLYNNVNYCDGLYQSIVRKGKTVLRGRRDTSLRFKYLVPHFKKDPLSRSFLDLGCNIGEFCNYVSSFGVEKVLGIDYHEGNLKFASGCKGTFINQDLRDIEKVNDIVIDFFGQIQIDVVFACSIYIEMDGKLWDLLNLLNWKVCYLESNPLYKCQSMIDELNDQPYIIEKIDEYNDPGFKILWRLTRHGTI